MKNPTGNKLEKLVFGMFDQMIEGADKYVTKQGSTWLIFTEDKRWVIEFTNDKTLWFNYNVFQSELDLIGKDCTEERDLIKRWFELRFLNKPKVKETHRKMPLFGWQVEDAIQNGVKATYDLNASELRSVEDTIENGVKETQTRMWPPVGAVDETIQNGVKETTPSGYLGSIEMKGKIVHQFESPKQNNDVEDTIINGVRHSYDDAIQLRGTTEEIIQEGVKDIIDPFWMDPVRIKDTIQNGVKETKSMCGKRGVRVDYTIQNGVKDTRSYSDRDKKTVGDIIQGGVKEAKDDRLLRTVHVMNTIINGVKETKEMKHNRNRYHGHFILEDDIPTYIPMVQVQDVIENGVKHVEDGGWLDQDERIDDIIESGVKAPKLMSQKMSQKINGVKHAQPMDEWVNSENIVSDVINVGVKEIIPSTFESEEQKDHWKTNDEITESIKDVIENGVKEVKTIETANANDIIDFIMDHELMDMPEIIDNVIENGVKEVKEISNFDLTSEIFKVNAKRAIRDGVKELKELPDKSGELRGYGDWYHRQGNMTKPHTEYVKEIIEDSYNHMGRVEGVIRNTDKDGI